MTNTENRFNAAIAAIEGHDYDTAFTLFTLLANDGDVPGQHFLAWCYEQGLGVKKNENAAFALWRKAAQAGMASSQLAVGVMYEEGRGTEKDLARAYYWYMRAAQSGEEESMKRAERLETVMAPEDLRKASTLKDEV